MNNNFIIMINLLLDAFLPENIATAQANYMKEKLEFLLFKFNTPLPSLPPPQPIPSPAPAVIISNVCLLFYSFYSFYLVFFLSFLFICSICSICFIRFIRFIYYYILT